MEQILLAHGLPKETVTAITILYRNTKVKVRSPDGDTEYFDIVAGVLQGDTLTQYLLWAILNKSWRQHPTRHQLYGHLPPITKTILVRRTRYAGHCWRSSDELISDVLLWTPTYGRAKAGRPAWTYIQQLCEDTGCSPEDLPEAMNDREKWRERVRDIRACVLTWWWWFQY